MYRKLSVHFVSIRQTKACLGQALLCSLPEFLSHVSWKVMLSSTSVIQISGCFLGNNQRHKIVQQSKEYYLKSYKTLHNPASAAMLHAFTLACSPFCAAKLISTVRWGGVTEAEEVEYRQQLFKLWSVAGESRMYSNCERIQHDPDHSEGELIKIKILMQAHGRSMRLRGGIVVKIQ